METAPKGQIEGLLEAKKRTLDDIKKQIQEKTKEFFRKEGEILAIEQVIEECF